MEKLLQAWSKAVSEAHFHEATAFCATPAARARALHFARRAERRAARLAEVLRKRYGINPYEALARGEIK